MKSKKTRSFSQHQFILLNILQSILTLYRPSNKKINLFPSYKLWNYVKQEITVVYIHIHTYTWADRTVEIMTDSFRGKLKSVFDFVMYIT